MNINWMSDKEILDLMDNEIRYPPDTVYFLDGIPKFIRQCVKDSQKELVRAIQLILPLAKGYANAHDVGSNQKYVEIAQQILRKAMEGSDD